MFSLSLFHLIGGIPDETSTPSVIIDILKAYYKVKSLDQAIENPITLPLTGVNFGRMAYYVNTDKTVNWDRKNILNGWERLIEFAKTPHLPNGFNFGPITPLQPGNYNLCMIYRYLKTNNISISPQTTIDEMVAVCRALTDTSVDPQNAVIQAIYDRKIPHDVLRRLYVNYHLRDIPSGCTSYDEFVDILENSSYTRTRIIPSNKLEAVALAAYNYSLNISRALDPITEYAIIHRSPDDYKPKDIALIAAVALANNILDLTLTFEPTFPEKMYKDEVLESLFATECFSNITDSRYNMLMLSCTSYTFYEGGKPTPNTALLYGAEASSLCVSYGIYGESMTIFTFQELADTFNHYKFYRNPTTVGEKIFSERDMAKLKNIISRYWWENDTIYEKRSNAIESLRRAMEVVDDEERRMGTVRRDFGAFFQDSSDAEKKVIIEFLQKLFHAAMYMRGWEGGDDEYPLVSKPTDNDMAVQRTTIALSEFYDYCKAYPIIGNKILTLPLYNRIGTTLVQYTENGSTIAEKLEIVGNGRDTDISARACIRTSSNIFAFSVHAYTEAAGLHPPFQLHILREFL